MKKSAIAIICVGSLLGLSAPHLLAKEMPADMMQMSKVLSDLKSKGYSIVKKVEFEKGMYEIQAINGEGKSEKIKMNGKTGEIVKPKDNKEYMSALEIAKKVEEAGYHNIFKIETEWFGKKYEVKAYNKENKKVKLDVDAVSGKVMKD